MTDPQMRCEAIAQIIDPSAYEIGDNMDWCHCSECKAERAADKISALAKADEILALFTAGEA